MSGPKTWRLLEKRIEEDQSLDFARVLPFQYATGIRRWHPLRGYPDLDTVADSLKEYLRTEAGSFERLVLVTHSMGGLVAQCCITRMLADGNGPELARIRRVVMLACPNEGSELQMSLRRGVLGPGHPQESALRPLNTRVADIRRTIVRDVLHATAVRDRTCPIAFSVYAGDSDRVVSAVSARSMFPDAAALPGDHFTILKTTTPEHRTFTTVRRLLHESAAGSGQARGAHRVDGSANPSAHSGGTLPWTAADAVAGGAVQAVPEPPAAAQPEAEHPAEPPPQAEPPDRSAVRGVHPRGPVLPHHGELRRRFEEFADVMRRQIDDESSRDKAADPILMPVRWSVTERHPGDHPVNVWGGSGGVLPSLETGTSDTLADLFASIPTGRMVVLGKGGAGKTVLVRELARRLLNDRADSAVPVLFRLPSWNPDQTTLRDWMVARLAEDYPPLGEKIGDSQPVRSVAVSLVDGQHVLPILDGLDEVAPPLRAIALRRINEALRSGDRLVLTSRPTEYAEAVGAGRGLALAAVVELHDLTPDDLRAYLPRTTRPMDPRQPGRTKWDRVLRQFDELGATGTPVLGEVLTTPLMASLARAVYSETHADPAELLDTEVFPDSGAVTDHLLDAYVDVKYDDPLPAPADSGRPRWRPDDARRWLGFLAVMMSAQEADELAWWKPRQWRSMRLFNWPANGLMILTGI
ncbi:NACHT domain-containing protein, partial [Streptomyces shenzhenensis]|uniref:NACHT domain-containing protein n=1 Tax=Streptomyces shenzhenensis TaxID=943815 RepID=UPI001F344069